MCQQVVEKTKAAVTVGNDRNEAIVIAEGFAKGWPEELESNVFELVDYDRLISLLKRYQEEPHLNPATKLLFPSVFSEETRTKYEMIDGQIGRISNPLKDALLLSTAGMLRGYGNIPIHDPDAVKALTMEVIQHYSDNKLARLLFSLPKSNDLVVQEGSQKLIIIEEYFIDIYKGIENVLFEIYDELEEGEVFTDEIVTRKLLSIVETAKQQRNLQDEPIQVSATRQEEIATDEDRYTETSEPLYLYIPETRLILLSMASFGLYEAYWIYKNWQYINERNELDLNPFWRGVFGIFFLHSLMRKMQLDAEVKAIQKPSFSPGFLANSWIIVRIMIALFSSAPVGGFLAFLIPSSLLFLPVQNHINLITSIRSPEEPYYRWSIGHIFCLVFGLLTWTLIVLNLIETYAVN